MPKDLISILSSFGEKFSPSWSCQFEDFLILAESESGLKNILGNYLDQNTLGENINFKILQNRLSNENSFIWWGNLKPCWCIGKRRMESKLKNFITSSIGLSTYCIQGVQEDRFSHLHLVLKKMNPLK